MPKTTKKPSTKGVKTKSKVTTKAATETASQSAENAVIEPVTEVKTETKSANTETNGLAALLDCVETDDKAIIAMRNQSAELATTEWKQKELARIEHEIKTTVESAVKAWIKIYELIRKVELDGLWRVYIDQSTGVAVTSISKWVQHLATDLKINESYLWSCKKSGSYYSQLLERCSGAKLPQLNALSIPADSMVLVEKVAQGDDAKAIELIKKINNQGLTRAELKSMWAEVKSHPDFRAKVNAYGTKKELSDKSTTATRTDSLTAGKICELIAYNRAVWLPERVQTVERPHGRAKFEAPVFAAWPEFAVQTGLKTARRIDLLAIETYSVEKPAEMLIHGIEVKVAESDLVNDIKMGDYVPHIDYAWLAVPDKLKTVALEHLREGWGLLIVSENSVTVEVNARFNRGIMRDATLAECCYKLLTNAPQVTDTVTEPVKTDVEAITEVVTDAQADTPPIKTDNKAITKIVTKDQAPAPAEAEAAEAAKWTARFIANSAATAAAAAAAPLDEQILSVIGGQKPTQKSLTADFKRVHAYLCTSYNKAKYSSADVETAVMAVFGDVLKPRTNKAHGKRLGDLLAEFDHKEVQKNK